VTVRVVSLPASARRRKNGRTRRRECSPSISPKQDGRKIVHQACAAPGLGLGIEIHLAAAFGSARLFEKSGSSKPMACC
jgi:hypothetical protein